MFEIISQKNNRRIGKIETKHGVINTPFFMPDATRGFVKSLDKADLEKIGVESMVVNTYHLYLEPGEKLIAEAGGLGKFMHWDGPTMTDSGGFQVFSLEGRITEEGVIFQSHLDGSKHFLGPENSIQISEALVLQPEIGSEFHCLFCCWGIEF